MEPDATASSGIADRIKGWLTWLAGAATGIAALFYAVGYLSLRAHAELLGLTGFVQFDHDEFLQEGARFFIVAAAAIGQSVLAATAGLGALSLIVLGLRRVALQSLAKLPRVISGAARWAPRGRRVAFAVVALAFLWTLWDDIGAFRSPLCVTSLLYRAPDLSACPKDYDAPAFISRLQEGQSQALQQAFDDLLFAGLGHAIFLTALAAWLARPWTVRRWLLLPFLLAVGLMLLLLPMTYGVMVKPVRYPRVALTLADHSANGERLYLVHRDEHGIVVWDSERRVLVWQPLSAVLRADVEGIDNPLAGVKQGEME